MGGVHTSNVPLTADHAHVGMLDATLPDLGAGLDWVEVHRARPRAPLTCRGCRHRLHAKVSRGGLRFFAHDPGARSCALAGESLAHRLLKLNLAPPRAMPAGPHI